MNKKITDIFITSDSFDKIVRIQLDILIENFNCKNICLGYSSRVQ